MPFRSVHRRCASAAAVVVCALGAGCGSDAARPAYHTSPSPTFAAEHTPAVFVTAVPVSSDSVITITPSTYDPTSPCFSVAVTTTVASLNAVPADCLGAWGSFTHSSIPGQALIAGSPVSTLVHVQQGIPIAEATADATAYYRFVTARLWAYSKNITNLVKQIDTPGEAALDGAYAEMSQKFGGITLLPQCMYPRSFRVTRVDATVQAYFQSEGAAHPSDVAIVDNYPVCPGIVFGYQDGSAKTLFGNATAESDVQTGTIVHTDSPFGNMFITDGYGVCGEPALKSVCGF